jgi:hypothetical protein
LGLALIITLKSNRNEESELEIGVGRIIQLPQDPQYTGLCQELNSDDIFVDHIRQTGVKNWLNIW